jgi:hypothetical protein
MRLAAVWLLAISATPAFGAELVVLTRDGLVRRVTDGPPEPPRAPVAAQPRALTALPTGRYAAVIGDGLFVIDGAKRKQIPGKFGDLRSLAAPGTRLCGASDGGEVVQIDVATGKRLTLAHWPRLGRVAADGEALLAEHDGLIEEVGVTPVRNWKFVGHVLAMAAVDGHVFAATREGPLWQLDRATGRVRDLGFGSWFGTLALAAEGTRLYVVTQSGKLWQLDFAKGEKTALAMGGWEAAVGLAVSR